MDQGAGGAVGGRRRQRASIRRPRPPLCTSERGGHCHSGACATARMAQWGGARLVASARFATLATRRGWRDGVEGVEGWGGGAGGVEKK